MKRWLTMLVALTVALMAVGSASADAWFNPESGTGFIGRGDVIAYAGKDALVMPSLLTGTPEVTWTGWRDETATCIYDDGSTRTLTPYPTLWAKNWIPGARFAPGSDNITGYVLPGLLFLFGDVYRGAGYVECFNSGDRVLVWVTFTYGQWYDTHLYYRPPFSASPVEIPYTLVQ
jgi:hypothetical protein